MGDGGRGEERRRVTSGKYRGLFFCLKGIDMTSIIIIKEKPGLHLLKGGIINLASLLKSNQLIHLSVRGASLVRGLH